MWRPFVLLLLSDRLTFVSEERDLLCIDVFGICVAHVAPIPRPNGGEERTEWGGHTGRRGGGDGCGGHLSYSCCLTG